MPTAVFADKIQMQHRLFAELSSMFGREVPLYDKALLVNRACNTAVCSLLERLYPGFSVSEAQLERASGERHGAIRIGKPVEYRWIARFFAAFAMEPHNYYDMTNVGAKSQPIVATAFRAVRDPEHRVFCSLLQTDYFDPATRKRIEDLLATREVFTASARALIEKGERQGGLDWSDADALIREGTHRIFKWTGQAQGHSLYKDLCDAGFKIAADIACFGSHHLNHLTPNTLCMDLYTAAMKHCLGEMDRATFAARAQAALVRLISFADRDYLRLHFRHLSREFIDAFPHVNTLGASDIEPITTRLVSRLNEPDLTLNTLKHAGYKDFTEGPSEDTPVLLRQDAYKALTEPVKFINSDGSVIQTAHTARFGEIEQRFYATTPSGRDLYDRCLTIADAARERDPSLPKRDFPAYQALYAAPFAAFPKTLAGLLEHGLVYVRYSATRRGVAARGSIQTTDLAELVRLGFVTVEGLRYEDFLPVSAAGIFASNLNQYGTQSTAATKPVYTKEMLEDALGRSIIDTDAAYRGLQAESLLDCYRALGVDTRLDPKRIASLKADAALAPKGPAHSDSAEGHAVAMRA